MNIVKNLDIKNPTDYSKGIGDVTTHNIRNSDSDEVFSQYSDSDLLDFKNFEKGVYADAADLSSEDQLHSQSLPKNKNSDDEVNDSLRLVLPKIPLMPSLGNPIETYDQLREQYIHDTPLHPISITSNHSEISQANHTGNDEFKYTHTIMSRAKESAEHIDPSKTSKSRSMKNSRSSTDSNIRQSSHRSQKMLLDKERSIRLDQDKYINHLQHTINQLLTKHALAEETIDQLRLGVVINPQSRYKDQRHERRPTNSVKKKHPSRRYSSIVDNSNFHNYEEESKYLSRAKSVDMTMFDNGLLNIDFSQQHLPVELGGSMKYLTHDTWNDPDMASEVRTIGNYFQSRIRILNEVSTTLQNNSSGRTSVSSGSRNGQVMGADSLHHTPIAKRIKDLQMAFDDLQADFNGFRQINKNRASEFVLLSNEDVHEIEGDLFQLGMKIDDLERNIGDGRITPTNNNNHVLKTGNQVEEEYRHLIDRYNTLKGSQSPTGQKTLDEVVQQLQYLVKRYNGQYADIPTEHQLESMMQHDIIDKIKRNMSLSSPRYFQVPDVSKSLPDNDTRIRKAYRMSRNDMDSDDLFLSVKSPLEDKSCSLPATLASDISSCHDLARNDRYSVGDSLRKSVHGMGSVLEQGDNSPGHSQQARILHSNGSGLVNSEIGGTLNRSPFHNDFNELDKQLERLQLNERRHWLAADEIASRTTGSSLYFSPSTAVPSRPSVASSYKSSGHWNDVDNGRKKRKKKSRCNDTTKVPGSDGDWDSDESLKAPVCGPAIQSRDGWSQTTRSVFGKRSMEKEFRSETDDPHIDHVAYWHGESFQPSREPKLRTPVRRRPSNPRKTLRQDHRTRSLYVPEEEYWLPGQYGDDGRSNYRPEVPVSREYYPMEPHRYLVREYGQRTRPVFAPPVTEDDSDDNEDYDYDSSSRDLDRIRRGYLDEAVLAAQSMRRYTKRISDLCERRQFEDNRSSRDTHAQYR